ncbi:MAG: CofH family radical SAM protein [Thaumarchaeota archaeon]|nr:CofH family radical SAM protein [Nitrososphaerota archaeon]
MGLVTAQLHQSEIGDILERVVAGHAPDRHDCMRLLKSDDVHLMGMAARHLVQRRFGRRATYVNNIILNYTNVCITDCTFCAFYRPPGHDESYTLDISQIRARVKTAHEMFGIRQVLFQGGHNPKLGIEYFEEAFSMIRDSYPGVGVHALSPSEIDMVARVERSSTAEVLSRLKEAGLQSVPGAGAEILKDDVKDVISPKKISSSDWLRIMREAHSLGLPSSATMMYGHAETASDIADHFFEIAKLQEETGGFMAFIPWNFEPGNTPMQRDGLVDKIVTSEFGSGGIQLLKMIAISRLVYDASIPHVQSSWLTNGVGMAQLALQYGADDFGGTLIGEEVVSCTGARSTELTGGTIRNAISQMGYEAAERDNFYRAA